MRVAATTSPQPDKSENLHKAPGPNGYWYILLYIWLYYWEWPYYFPPLVAPLRQPLVAANAEFRHRPGTGQNYTVTLEPQSFQGFLWLQKVGYFFFRPRLLQRGTKQIFYGIPVLSVQFFTSVKVCLILLDDCKQFGVYTFFAKHVVHLASWQAIVVFKEGAVCTSDAPTQE